MLSSGRELGMVDDCRNAVAMTLACGSVVALSSDGSGVFERGDCVFADVAFVVQVTRLCTGCASNRSACEIGD